MSRYTIFPETARNFEGLIAADLRAGLDVTIEWLEPIRIGRVMVAPEISQAMHLLLVRKGQFMNTSELIAHLADGLTLAASPRFCALVDDEGVFHLQIEPSLGATLIQAAGHEIRWMPMHSWYRQGVVGWRSLFPKDKADQFQRMGLDFFKLTQ